MEGRQIMNPMMGMIQGMNGGVNPLMGGMNPMAGASPMTAMTGCQGMNPMMSQMMNMFKQNFGGKDPQQYLQSMSAQELDSHVVNMLRGVAKFNAHPDSLIGVIHASGLDLIGLKEAIKAYKK